MGHWSYPAKWLLRPVRACAKLSPVAPKRQPDREKTTNLKDVAAAVKLSPSTVSLVLNQSPLASSIPGPTQDRIFAAARRLNYRPNFLARSLRAQRTYSLGVLVPEVSDGYSSQVLSGIEDTLFPRGYWYLIASHRHKPDLIRRYPKLLLDRCVEGLVLVDTPCDQTLSVPVVSVSGHQLVKGLTNIVLNHRKAARLALRHLVELGHRRVAVVQGQIFSSDTQVRWESICVEAQALQLRLDPRLVARLEGDTPSPETGYVAAQKLLASRLPFTAVFAFNDISAIGVIRALHEANLRVPEDVSVVGFDDIHLAAYNSPALTTVRQPLWEMGRLASETVLDRLGGAPDGSGFARQLTVEPELVVRESTGTASTDW